MNKTFYSGEWYMTISDEPPMSGDGKTYYKFDLIRNMNSFYGCPVQQFGNMEEILNRLIRYKEIHERPEYDCIREVYKDKADALDYFIQTLHKELGQ